MKISRLHIDDFAIEDYPTIIKDDIEGDNLLIKGNNRSGKTLTLNALLYGLYGPSATFGVQPGRRSEVNIYFDNGGSLSRGGGGREYRHNGQRFELDDAEDMIRSTIGPKDTVRLQFIHSEIDNLPLASITGDELIATVRRVMESEVQEQIDEYREEKEELEAEIEQVERTEVKPRRRDLRDIDLRRYEQRLEKIEQLQSLIDTGRIETIKQRLLENQDLNEQLENLYNRKRTIEHQLRKLNRKLREEKRYTEQVNELIINAIDELTCPVCDQVVEEQTARNRLSRGNCPQCGRKRSLEELKSNLEEKIDRADSTVEELEAEIEELEEEKENIENEIQTLQSSISDLSDLNDLTKLTLEENDYDLEAVEERTQKELEQYQEQVDHLSTKQERLDDELEQAEQELEELQNSLEQVDERITELVEESHAELITVFQEDWSQNYQDIAQDFGLELHIEEDGSVLLPGNEGTREYDELSTGEVRLLNLAFAISVAQNARENDDYTDSFETIVLDEPFANLDDEKREHAMDYIGDSNIQFVITSSNEELQQYFNTEQTETLETLTIQLTFEDYD